MMRGSLLLALTLAALVLPNTAAAIPVPCSNFVCEASNPDATLRIAPGSTPGAVDDGFGHRAKTAGGIVSWNLRGHEIGFATGIFYQVNGGPVRSVTDFIDLVEPVQDDERGVIEITYQDKSIDPLRIVDRYSLIYPAPPGSFLPGPLSQRVTIQNIGDAPLELDFFLYRDFDLDPQGFDRRAYAASGNLSTSECSIIRQYGIETVLIDYFRRGLEPADCGFDLFGGTFSGGDPLLLSDLDNLGNYPKSIGGGDIIYARRYSVILAPDQSIFTESNLGLVVPTPGTSSLLALGIGILMATRARRVRAPLLPFGPTNSSM